LDEAHIIKNPKSKVYQCVKKIQSERRIILTGTPIQNNVMELWTLFDFLMPGFLGSENDFEIKYHKKIHTNIKKLNLEEKLQEKIFQTSLLDIRRRIKPFILRRLKQDVLKELPDKIIQDYICEMTPIQKDLHKFIEDMEQKKQKGNNMTLKLFDLMRKACNYPALLLNEETIINSKEFHNRPQVSFTDINSTGKLKSLEDIFISLNFEEQEITDYDNKVLIFTQYRKMIEVISEFISKKFPHLKFLKLSSDTSVEERAKVVDTFNNNSTINILILTTSIGGLGLSLTSANIVIMYDHDWNPMKDLQAMDRAHRLGQRKIVEVFRLITADSIEERLISLQTFKKYIANNVVDATQIHETNLNVNNFMESLEDYKSNHKITQSTANKRKTKSQILNEEYDNKEELELEYLKKFIN
jgi:TATA-binding protein-associated factor